MIAMINININIVMNIAKKKLSLYENLVQLIDHILQLLKGRVLAN